MKFKDTKNPTYHSTVFLGSKHYSIENGVVLLTIAPVGQA
ncbi:hypothetical protein CDIMF43_200205 [Carnobacterium divergens]|nr:hypothetical protein CDIMF43_200205 [Carnobacterium divergens]